MRFKVTKDIVCVNSETCSEKIEKKLQDKFPKLEHGINCHLSIHHVDHNHTIWFFVYDKDGVHESEVRGQTKKTDSDLIKKYTGNTSQIKDTLETLQII